MTKKETELLKQILKNQATIMRNLAFGFTELRKGEILNEALLNRIEETRGLIK